MMENKIIPGGAGATPIEIVRPVETVQQRQFEAPPIIIKRLPDMPAIIVLEGVQSYKRKPNNKKRTKRNKSSHRRRK